MQTEQLLCWGGMTDIRHTTSGSNGEEHTSSRQKLNGVFTTRAKFCQLIASFSANLLQLKLTKLKLELQSGFQHIKERYENK